MPRKKKSVHDELKQWLLDLGAKSGYDEAYSGDSEPIDIRIGEKHVEYHPDVVWNYRGGLHIIELAFSDDWRAIAGELLLASIAKNCKWFCVITVGDYDFWNALFKIIEKKLDFHKWSSYTFEDSDLTDVEKMKKEIKAHLKTMQWLS